MSEMRTFFKYVIPSILSFALSGIYAIVDGFFVGHSVGDMGLSAINVAYPVSAVLQAAGTGIGIGGAVYYSISIRLCFANKKQSAFTDCFLIFMYLQNHIQEIFHPFSLPEPLWLCPRPISNSQLHVLPHFHLCPIYLVVFKGSYYFRRDISS